MRLPRSPRLLRMLTALEEIYSNADTPAAERMQAVQAAQRILNRKPGQKSTAKKRDRNVKSVLNEIRKLQSEGKQ